MMRAQAKPVARIMTLEYWFTFSMTVVHPGMICTHSWDKRCLFAGLVKN